MHLLRNRIHTNTPHCRSALLSTPVFLFVYRKKQKAAMDAPMAGMPVDPEEFVASLTPAVRARVEALQVGAGVTTTGLCRTTHACTHTQIAWVQHSIHSTRAGVIQVRSHQACARWPTAPALSCSNVARMHLPACLRSTLPQPCSHSHHPNLPKHAHPHITTTGPTGQA